MTFRLSFRPLSYSRLFTDSVPVKPHITKTQGKTSDNSVDIAKSQREVANTKPGYILSMRMGQVQDQDSAFMASRSPDPKQPNIGKGPTDHAQNDTRSNSRSENYKTLQTKKAELEAKCERLSEELEFTARKLESSESLRIAGLEDYDAKYAHLKCILGSMTGRLQQFEQVEAQHAELAQAERSANKHSFVTIKGLISTIALEISDEEYIDRESITTYCE